MTTAQPGRRTRPGRVLAVASAVATAAVLPAALTGCAAGATTSSPAAVTGEHQGTQHPAARGELPSAHAHAVAVNPTDGRVHLATHDGLFRYQGRDPVRVGPVIDLMGFTVAADGAFYASGHPGPGTDLPDPVGLIRSTDGGTSWEELSRQGESDFHALTASDAGVTAFDGAALSATTDGATWRDLSVPVTPYALASSPDGQVLLATSQSGPVRSTDTGATWAPVDGAPLLQVVDWADGATVVGVTPDGAVAVSTDAGVTWQERGNAGGPPQAVGAHALPDGTLRVLVVTDDAVLDSVDAGATLAPLGAS